MFDEKLRKFATLLIGKDKDVKKFTESEYETLVPIVKEDGQVQMTLDKYEIYFLTDLKLARSLDFRPDGKSIEGIVLVLTTPASNWRNYQQWLGRVGRHGDDCLRIAISAEIDTEKNL